jgi:hypothetical protein
MHKVPGGGHPDAPAPGPLRKQPEPSLRRRDSAATTRRARAEKSARRQRGGGVAAEGEGAGGGEGLPPWPAAGATVETWDQRSPDAEPALRRARLSSAALPAHQKWGKGSTLAAQGMLGGTNTMVSWVVFFVKMGKKLGKVPIKSHIQGMEGD